MTRRRVLTAAIALFAVAAGGVGGAYWSLNYVPDFYSETLVEEPDPEVRQAAAKKFVQRTLALVDDIQHSDQWATEISQPMINSWLAEELHLRYGEMVPPGVSDPRLRFQDETVLVGFRFQKEDWDGIISLELRPWVPSPNRLAIEVRSVKAGVVPLPIDSVLPNVTRELKKEGFRSEWTQTNGNDVLLIHLDKFGDRQPVLERVRVRKGAIQISGRNASAQAHVPALLGLSSLFQTRR